ncbi:sigma-54 dependent transcriptional regulator [Caballeronia sp. SEWSISQ10-4 2]|nr:sigma-54 dependent transcriptional regulator [Caballeronia sp. SEWSISQ10-4 2]
MIERVAPTDHALLIFGPTGSGKELVARRVHECGLNNEHPFVDLNCGAIPENLVETELFGHVKGAFTGATENRPGLFEQVGKGTLFLDEVGELPLALQPKLLRVLETHTFRPVGSSTNLHFEGRIVAATHRDLRESARNGAFRADLFYRLAVFVLTVPGLEERKDDIPGLVAHFAAKQSRRIEFAPAALKRLCQQPWPGHIRQLRNLVSQLSVLAERTRIDVEILEPFLAIHSGETTSRASLADTLLQLEGTDKLAAAETLMIDRALELNANNKSAAAELLGVSRKTIERRLKSREESFREARSCLERGNALVEQSRFRGAIPLLRRCLDIIEKNSDHGDTRRVRFEAYRSLGVCLRSVHGWLYAEATACYAAALVAGEGLCEPTELASVQFGIWTTQLTTLELGHARATAQDMVLRAHGIDSCAAREEAHLALANTLFWLGDSDEVLACLARGGLLGLGSTDTHTGVQGFDLTGLALTFEGLAAYQTGAIDQAWQALETLVARAAASAHHTLDHAMDLQGAVWLACLFNDTDRMGTLAAELEALSEMNGFAFYRGVGQIFRACHLSALGAFEEAETLLLDGYEHLVGHGGALFYSFMIWQHGELLLRAGRLETGEAILTTAIDLVFERQERAYLTELLIIKARTQWARGDLTVAEQGLRTAMSTALTLGSVPARIDAAKYLADLLHKTNRTALAIETLERALRLPRLTRATAGIIQATQLLADLRSASSLNPHE